MEFLSNFGRLYVHTIHQHAGGPSFCATRLGKKAPYQHLGMKLLWRLSSKEEIPLVVKIIGPFHCLQSATKYLPEILLRRLTDAGAEDRIWPTQFGFRSGCGCADALFIARRKVENAWARKDGNLLLLALDWAKAFDSISPAGLVNAMSRFGIPFQFCSVVRGIYNGRHFMVRDGGATSHKPPSALAFPKVVLYHPFCSRWS